MTRTHCVRDPRAIIEQSPMGLRQWIVVALMIALNALDGFDVLSSAFAAPGLSKEWGVPREALGVVLSAELVGMGFGSMLLGGLADKFGRKPLMLVCLVDMAIGMWMAHNAHGVTDLTAWRFVTGIGIGGMLAATNAVTAEVSNTAWRSLAMSLYVVGYPLGGVIGGYAAQSWLLVAHDWRAVFLFGAVVTAALIPLVWLLVPETPAFFAATRPEGAVGRINRSLKAFGLPLIGGLPPRAVGAPKPRVTDILANPKLRPVTLLLAFGYLFHTITFYFVLKWAVKIVADAGFTQPQAASTLTFANVGGVIGGLLFGMAMKRWQIRAPTIAMLLLGMVAVTWFGMGHSTLWGWRLAAGLAMFCTNAAIVGFYAAFALGFPAYARATGTGFVLGIGRAGAAGSPILAGFLFKALGNDHLAVVALVMALGSGIALVLVALLPLRDGDELEADLVPAGQPLD
jgi:predicted MFS family arabinose efflux permease